MQGFLYSALKLWAFFFLMFTSSNNIFTVKGRVPEENYPPISKPLFRGAGGLWSLSQHALDKKQE